MSSEKGTFSIYYGEGNVIYGPNGVDLSEFNCALRGITRPLRVFVIFAAVTFNRSLFVFVIVTVTWHLYTLCCIHYVCF
jgi:hypothetical protein